MTARCLSLPQNQPKMRYPYLLLLAAAAAFSLPGCQGERLPSEPEQQRFAELFVRYIAPQRQMKATAEFLEGDSLQNAQPVELPDGLRLQGRPMEARYLTGNRVRYSIEHRADYDPSYKFTFEGLDGQAQDYVLSMKPIKRFEIVGGQASLSKGMTLFVEDGRLLAGERLVLLFSDANNQATTISLGDPAARDTFKIAALRLHKLKPGPHTLYLVKQKRQEEAGKALSVVADMEYYTDTLPFEVVE